MNVFSHDQVLSALAATYFSGQAASVKVRTVAGQRFRLLHVGDRGVITRWPMLDFWEPTDALPAGRSARRPLFYLPRVCRETVAAPGGPTDFHGLTPSPFVRWDQFADWEDFRATVRTRRRSLDSDTRRQLRRLQADYGPVRYTFETTDDLELDACIRWRSERFEGAAELFRDPRHREFVRRLRDRGPACVSALYAGDALIAVHIGLLHDGRFYYWLPAFDPAARRYSPGRLLLEFLLEETYRRGCSEFDFLFGSEDYKWIYATHARLIGAAGFPAWFLQQATIARRHLRVRSRLRHLGLLRPTSQD